MLETKKQVAVVGAGISGVLTAYYLALRGFQVTVYEEQRYAAMRCSYANGGQISASNSETWATWSNVKKGVKWLFKADAPFKLRPWRLDWAMWRWMFKFMLNSLSQSKHVTNTAETVKMALTSRELYDQICQQEKIEFDRSNCGIVHFYKTESYWQNAQRVNELYSHYGLSRVSVDHTTIHDLRYAKGIIGATLTASDWTGDIHKFCSELSKVLSERYSVVFHYQRTVTDLRELADKYDAVVVANGVGSTLLAKSISESLSVYPVKGYSITINNVDPEYLPKVSLLDDEAKIVTSSLGTRFRVAGTAELTGENYDITRDRIEPLLKWVHTNFPMIDTSDYSQWACLRPMTPDMMPIIKQSDNHAKIFYNVGHGHLGWTLGAYAADRVADLVLRETQ